MADASRYASEYLLFTAFGEGRHTKMSAAAGLMSHTIHGIHRALFSTFLTRENTKNVDHADPDPDIPIHEIGATIVRTLSSIKFNSIIVKETNCLTSSQSIGLLLSISAT